MGSEMCIRDRYYYGMKLHMVGQRREGTLPFPEMITLTPASDNDLTIFKSECVPYLSGKTVLADKIYSDFSFFNESNPVKCLLRIKRLKGNRKFSNRGRKLQETFSRKPFQKSDNLSNPFSTG